MGALSSQFPRRDSDGTHTEPIEQFSVLMGAILATPIRVVYQSAQWPFCRPTPKQRLADQVSGHALAHGVAHQVATEQIFVACQIGQPSSVGM